ncbi:hydroxymethylbilane synthase [Methanocaldococcus infernus]
MIIGSRGSKLALYQANLVLKKLKSLGIDGEIKIIKTRGDQIKDRALHSIGIGVFTKELDLSLLNHEIDIAVHSLKDIPTVWNSRLSYVVLERDYPNDLLIANKEDIKVIGTSSLRRRAFLKELYRDAEFKLLRGNVDTRLRKLKDNEYDAIVLSEAGVRRLNIDLSEFLVYKLPILPAPGQGVIAVAYRKEDKKIKNILEKINDKKTFLETTAERKALNELGCGCHVPFGALAKYEGKRLMLKVAVANKDGVIKKESSICCEVDEIEKAEKLGESLGRELRRCIREL